MGSWTRQAVDTSDGPATHDPTCAHAHGTARTAKNDLEQSIEGLFECGETIAGPTGPVNQGDGCSRYWD